MYFVKDKVYQINLLIKSSHMHNLSQYHEKLVCHCIWSIMKYVLYCINKQDQLLSQNNY